MSSDKTVLYIKGEANTEVSKREVALGDILSVACARKEIETKVKCIRLMKIPEKGQHRYVISILKIIELIQKEFPQISIQNLGEKDLILTYEEEKQTHTVRHWTKTILVAAVTFFGAAFSMMAFNNDVDVTTMFGQIYELVMGEPSNGFTVLELTYCLGVILGILIFFNHFGKKKFTVDPTPMEVEMRLYEKDIQSTLVEGYDRKGQELDVDA